MKHNYLRNYRSAAPGAILFVVSAVMMVCPAAAYANSADGPGNPSMTVDFQNGDTPTVLKALFTDAGVNYSIDPDVSGTLSVTMSNVPFLAVLRTVLHANNPPLTFDYTEGVFYVRVRQHEPAVKIPPADGGDIVVTRDIAQLDADLSNGDKRYYRIPVNRFDVRLMAQFIGNIDRKIVEVVPSDGSVTGGGVSGNISIAGGQNGGQPAAGFGAGSGAFGGVNGIASPNAGAGR